MPPAGFEPTIPASKRPQTHALDRAATGVGHNLKLGLLQTKHLTNSDKWKEGHALTETHIFDRISDRICMLSTRPSSPLLRDSTHTAQVNCIFFSKWHNISVWCLCDRASLTQQYKQPTRCNNNNFIDNFNQLNMFRAIVSPIFRSTRLCLQLVV